MADASKPKEAELDLGQRETDQWHLVGKFEELKSKPCRKLFMKDGWNLALFYVEAKNMFYVTNSSCPHAKGPLEQGDIEEVPGSGAYTVTCPLHYYSFDLDTGESPTGLKLAVYKTEIRGDDLYALTPHPLSLKRL